MSMTNEQIQALKASALAATTGDWTPDTNFGFSIQCDRPGLDRLLLTVNGPNSENDLRFISQAQPDVILSLLAEREADKALIAEQATRIAELEARALTVTLPDELYAIAENIRTQDNRCADQPMFAVMQKREIIGSDDHSPSRIVWCWDGEEVSELRASRLEALHQGCRDTRGYDRYAMQEIDEFVTACFTEQGCRDYLARDGHNLRLPFIYAFGSFRNSEYQFVRKWLAGITLVVGGE